MSCSTKFDRKETNVSLDKYFILSSSEENCRSNGDCVLISSQDKRTI